MIPVVQCNPGARVDSTLFNRLVMFVVGTQYDVRQYGAQGDKVTDDTAAWTNALSAAGLTGGIVYAPPGTYRLMQELLVPTNVEVWLAKGATIRADATMDSVFANSDQVNGNGYIRVSGGGVIDANNKANYGIHVFGSLQTASGKDGFWVEGLEIKNALLDGYFTQQNSNLKNAIAYADNLIVHDCSRHGIHFQNNDGHHIIGCTIFSVSQHGIYLDQTADGAVVNNNIYSPNLNGINIAATSWASVIGNNIHSTLEHGISVSASDNISIMGNNIYDPSFQAANAYDGILLSNTLYSTVQGNTIKAMNKSPAFGIQESGTSDYNAICGNTFDDRTIAFGLGKIVKVGTHTQVRNNPGHITENQGTATVANATTSIVVTHGLSVTPALANIQVTMTNNPTNDVGGWWISSPTSTQFTINVRADPGASGASFVWNAAVL